MTTTPPEAPHDPAPADEGPRATRDEIRDLGRLRRSTTNRKVAGVAGGLARHLDIDPVILRVAFVVLVFFGGAGLILYGACWLLVPEEGRHGAPLGLDDRSRSVALIIVGGIAALALIGDSWGGNWFPWPIAIVALVVLLFLTRKDRHQPAGPPAAGPAPYAPPYAAPYTAAPSYAAAEPTAATAATAPVSATAPVAPVAPTAATPAAPTAPLTTAYSATSYTGWVPPAPVAPVRPRNPRKRGPILFWFTLALIALAEGVLGILDLAGAPIADPAYPALAVGLTGVMLLVGAFFGRAGGLILVGLVSTVALAGTTVANEWDGTDMRATPLTAAAVQSDYTISNGQLVLDLTRVDDLAALDGRTIHVGGDIGHVEVIVPRRLDVRVDAVVDGAGNITLFGQETGGLDIAMSREHSGGLEVPAITLDADLNIGQIEVHQ